MAKRIDWSAFRHHLTDERQRLQDLCPAEMTVYVSVVAYCYSVPVYTVGISCRDHDIAGHGEGTSSRLGRSETGCTATQAEGVDVIPQTQREQFVALLHELSEEYTPWAVMLVFADTMRDVFRRMEHDEAMERTAKRPGKAKKLADKAGPREPLPCPLCGTPSGCHCLIT